MPQSKDLPTSGPVQGCPAGKPDCPGHLPGKCPGHRKSDGLPCCNIAGKGTEHKGVGCCVSHGGRTPTHNAAAQLEQTKELARLIAGTEAPPADPVGVVLASLAASWWNVHTYEQMVAELPTHPDEDELVMGPDGAPYWRRGKPGLYGRTYHQSGIPTGEAKKSILLQLLDEERDRAFRQAAEAVKLGIEERRLRMAEGQAKGLFAAVGAALTEAKLNPEQVEAFNRALAANLRGSQPAAIIG